MVCVALFQPDIPQNVGSAIRLCACLDMGLHIIEPCSFPWNIKKIKDSALDYADHVDMTRHDSWEDFQDSMAGRRLILMTTKVAKPYVDFEFQDNDVLIAGRESAGVPDYVHEAADGRILIPMHAGLRSLNIVNATAMIAGEALRQTQWTI